MSSLPEDIHSSLIREAKEKHKIDKELDSCKKIMETGLYSVYLLSPIGSTRPSRRVVLIEHPPAQEPIAHVLPITILGTAPQAETNRKIMEAVEAHFS